MTPDRPVPIEASDWPAAFTPRRFAVLLLLLIGVSFPEVITGRGTFFHRDFGLFTYPIAWWQRESLWHGSIPLWNPLNYCGIPFLAQWNTAVLYPPALLYLVLPLSWSLGMFCLLHLFLAGMGMYFLAARWTQNNFAAAVAGTAFTFGALMVNCLMWTSNLAAFAWMPWVILTVEKVMHGERPSWWPAAVLAAAMQMLAGAPEPILLSWLVVAVLLVRHCWFASGRERLRAGGRFVMLVLIVTGLCALQLLPFLDLLVHSQRDAQFPGAVWSMPSSGWANFLVPLYRSIPTTFGPYAQPGQYWVSSYYPGAAVVALALVALWRVRQPRVWILFVLTLGTLLLALGENGFLYPLLRKGLPVLGLMRYPVKFVFLPALLLPLLAAFAVNDFISGPKSNPPRLRADVMLLFVLLAGAMGGLCWSAFRDPQPAAPWRITLVSSLHSLVFLVVVFGWLAAFRRLRSMPLQGLALLGVVLCFWLDPMTAGPRSNPTVPRWVYEPNQAQRNSGFTTVPRIGESRLMLSLAAQRNMNASGLTDPAASYVYSRLAMFGDVNLLEDIPAVTGFFSLYFHELNDVLTILYENDQPPAGLADFLAVSQITMPGTNTDWSPRLGHLPWATAGQQPVYADAGHTLAALASAEFDPRTTVYLLPEAERRLTVSNASEARIISSQFSAQREELEVEAPEPAMVVVAQSFYHCWRAVVDGKPVPLFRANHAFQALEVPAGRHRVELMYKDRLFQAGTFISIGTLFFCAAVWLVQRRPVRP